ncbi:MAG: WD40 repeat domain-containing serine/threonine protein kinase [Limisphaerales bacterium]
MDPDSSINDRQSMQTNTSASRARDEGLPPLLIPDHQLLRRIGRGSYGEVWLARNTMGTYRAVKVVYRKSFVDQRPFEREVAGIRKFEPISRSHDGFVDVLHVGINEEYGYFYYVMELGDDWKSGQSIDPENYTPKTLSQNLGPRAKLSAQECLQLGLALSQALAELHKDGLVHRDVKPSNIIFVNGVPKLADIGLVVGVNEAHSYVGTEGFIPPEGPGTAQADVYSLGKVLYEASTGKDRQDFPELPTWVDQFEDRERFLELNEVILIACKNDLNQRYASAWDMHADLLVLVNGKSVKRLKTLERRLSNLKRVAGISALILAVLAAIFYEVYREWRGALESRQRQVGANVAYGTRAVDAGDLLGALPYFAQALTLERQDRNPATLHRLRFGCVLDQCPKLVQLWCAPKDVAMAGFSPDGQQLLTVEWLGKAQILDVNTGKAISPPFGQSYGLYRGAYSPDGTFVVTASGDKTACVWRVRDGAKVLTVGHPQQVSSASFSPDGLRIITGCEDHIARVWNAQTGEVQLTLHEHTDVVLFAAFSRDGRWIVTTSQDNTARIVNATNGQRVGLPLKHPTWVGYAAFSPDGRKLVTACFDHKARVWETETGRQILPDMTHRDGVNSAEFSPDGRLIVTAGLDHVVRIWLAENHQPLNLNPILRHSDRVLHAVFSPDGYRIATACADGTVRVWDLAGSAVAPLAARNAFSQDRSRFLTVTNQDVQVRDTLSGQAVSPLMRPGFFEEAELNPNGTFISIRSKPLEGANERREEVWKTETGTPMGPPMLLPNSLTNTCLSRDGTRLLAFGGNVAQTWDAPSGVPLSKGVLHDETILSGVFNPAGNKVATWSGAVVKVWDPVTGREFFGPLKHAFPVKWVEFSPDGSRFVTCGADEGFTKCQAQIWNAATGQPVGPPLKHDDGVLCASFSPDGSRVVTASEDFTAIVWDAVSGRQLTPALKHDNQVWTAAFSPDAKWIVTASFDKTARVWSAETGDPLTPPLRHVATLANAKFLADGRWIVTSDGKGNFWKWNLPLDERPVDDLRKLGRLLSGTTVRPPGEVNSPQSESLEVLWRQLQTRCPSGFATSSQEVAGWHEFEAEESELEQQWFAAAFHLQRLLSMRPGDQSLTERLTRAKAFLRSGN